MMWNGSFVPSYRVPKVNLLFPEEAGQVRLSNKSPTNCNEFQIVGTWI